MAEVRSPITAPSPSSHPPPSSDAACVAVAKDVAGLLALARALSGAVERGELAAIAVEEVRRLSGAEWVAVHELIDGRELPLLAESPGATGRAHDDRSAASSPRSPAWEAIRTLRPVWITSRADARERYPGVSLDRPGVATQCEAWAFLPLTADGGPDGVLTVAFAQGRAFEPHDRAWQTELAAECANALARGSLFTRERTRADASDVAHAALDQRFRAAEHLVIERTHLYERERFARGRAESDTLSARHTARELSRAQTILSALAGAETEREVSTILAEQAADAFHALGFTVTRRAGATELEIVRTAGFPAEVACAGTRLPIDGSTPEGDVVRSGAPLWLDSREEVVRRYPRLAEILLALGSAAWLGVPISSPGGIAGTFALTFRATRTFSGSDRADLERLALSCAAALERAGALDVERTARRRAERLEGSADRGGQLQDQLVATVAHDLRTPLQAIALGVKRLERSALGPAEVRAFERMSASVDRMDAMVRDLAESARTPRGPVELERAPVDLELLARRVIEELGDAGAGRNVALEAAGDVTVRADPHRLMQVVSNLVANALRYARGGTDVLVRAGATAHAVFLEVHNEGEPIAGRSCAALREALQRRGAGEPSGGHPGLGLVIVGDIVRAHGGTVSVESSEVHGTTFRVVLPFTDPR